MAFRLARAYDPPSADDGFRVLVDRLWPRGLRKDAAHVDRWLKEVAPSTELRRWYGHEPARFAEFARRYRAELAASGALAELRALEAAHGTVTLVHAAKDTEHSQARVLLDLLDEGRG